MVAKSVRLLALLAVLAAAACAKVSDTGPPRATQDEIAGLTRAFLALGPEVDPEEAARAARVTYEHTHELALAYQITDPPLIHNTKVNMGLRPRGLCYQWADDIEARLRQENFQTLQLHRAIANADTIRIDHSVTILGRRGDSLFDGIVLDPWRKGGVLTWAPVLEDDDYKWVPRDSVFAERRRQKEASRRVSQPSGGANVSEISGL